MSKTFSSRIKTTIAQIISTKKEAPFPGILRQGRLNKVNRHRLIPSADQAEDRSDVSGRRSSFRRTGKAHVANGGELRQA